MPTLSFVGNIWAACSIVYTPVITRTNTVYDDTNWISTETTLTKDTDYSWSQLTFSENYEKDNIVYIEISTLKNFGFFNQKGEYCIDITATISGRTDVSVVYTMTAYVLPACDCKYNSNPNAVITLDHLDFDSNTAVAIGKPTMHSDFAAIDPIS